MNPSVLSPASSPAPDDVPAEPLLARVQAEAAVQHAVIGGQLRLSAMSLETTAHFWLDFMRHWALHAQDATLPAPLREAHLVTAAAACLNWLDAQRAVPTQSEAAKAMTGAIQEKIQQETGSLALLG